MDTTHQHVDATGQVGGSTERALVLAGGGAAGNAWELGLIAGLADAGVDVTDAVLIIGTSAGSTVAAQITSGTRPAELYAAVLAEVHQLPDRRGRSGQGTRPERLGPSYLEWSNQVIGSAKDPSDMRRRMGAAALELGCLRNVEPGPLARHRRRSSAQPAVAAPTRPHHSRRCADREPVVFDRQSGVDLVDAVAASTSAMTPYRIGESATSTAATAAARTPTWRPAADGCSCCPRSAAGRACRPRGAWTSQPRSPSCAQAAAAWRRCSPTAARVTSSTPTRWTRPRVPLAARGGYLQGGSLAGGAGRLLAADAGPAGGSFCPSGRRAGGIVGPMAHFLLLHGACHGGWCWDPVATVLDAAGHRTTAPDLPCESLDAGLTESAAAAVAALRMASVRWWSWATPWARSSRRWWLIGCRHAAWSCSPEWWALPGRAWSRWPLRTRIAMCHCRIQTSSSTRRAGSASRTPVLDACSTTTVHPTSPTRPSHD